MTRTLIAGIGNVFLGDDGFGCAVANALVGRSLPDHVRVEDYGIRTMHLALDVAEGYDRLVIVDLLAGDEAPGTLRLLDMSDAQSAPAAFDGAHNLGPDAVLRLLDQVGGRVAQVFVVGCQPLTVEPGMELSAPVAAAVDAAVRMVESLVETNEPCA